MTAGPFAWVLGLIEDPRFGIPVLLLVEATILWTAWNPRAPASLGALRKSWTRPDGDPISRMYYALGDRRYSVVIRWSRERIEELYKARTGSPLPAVPFAFRRRSDLPANRFTLRRLTRELSAIEWEAREREAGLHLRWAFWRTRRGEADRYRLRIERLLERAQGSIAALEGAA